MNEYKTHIRTSKHTSLSHIIAYFLLQLSIHFLCLYLCQIKAGALSRKRQSIMGERQHGGDDGEEGDEEGEEEGGEGEEDGEGEGEEGEDKEEGEGEEGEEGGKKSKKKSQKDKDKANVDRDSTPVPFIVCGPYQVGG